MSPAVLRGGRGVRAAWIAVGIGLLLFVVANIHLVYVAVTSQPACVPHLKDAAEGAGFRAAKSAC